MINPENLFDNIPSLIEGEYFSELLNLRNVVIERIVSSDCPDNKVYCQEQDEWVILIKGEAELKINDDIVKLKTGDYLFIPGMIPHQVLITSNDCVWLAVHIFH
ncbi:cupin domain-containing protein [Geminocystis sp. CENA526]|uniref:cupin domain-containing protein n=1 Tax=Geminocystis sp. CENA526 TaxID=1355871 RepID=UPI003D6DD71C